MTAESTFLNDVRRLYLNWSSQAVLYGIVFLVCILSAVYLDWYVHMSPGRVVSVVTVLAASALVGGSLAYVGLRRTLSPSLSDRTSIERVFVAMRKAAWELEDLIQESAKHAPFTDAEREQVSKQLHNYQHLELEKLRMKAFPALLRELADRVSSLEGTESQSDATYLSTQTDLWKELLERTLERHSFLVTQRGTINDSSLSDETKNVVLVLLLALETMNDDQYRRLFDSPSGLTTYFAGYVEGVEMVMFEMTKDFRTVLERSKDKLTADVDERRSIFEAFETERGRETRRDK